MGILHMLVVAFLVIAGSGFFLVGTLGLLRFPDFYTRVHAVTKCDALGAGLVLLGLAIWHGPDAEGVRIVALIGLILVSSPTAGHALGRAAFNTGLKPWLREDVDERN
jgi:multicomponent Na+:H+ antiporter subunit G